MEGKDRRFNIWKGCPPTYVSTLISHDAKPAAHFLQRFGQNWSLDFLNPFPPGLDVMSVLDSDLSVLVFGLGGVHVFLCSGHHGCIQQEVGDTASMPAILMPQQIAPREFQAGLNGALEICVCFIKSCKKITPGQVSEEHLISVLVHKHWWFLFLLEKFLALINYIYEWDIEERDFSSLIGQEFKEKRRWKKMDMPVSESSYLLSDDREVVCCSMALTLGGKKRWRMDEVMD